MKAFFESLWKGNEKVHTIVNLFRIRSDGSFILPANVQEFRRDPVFGTLPMFTEKQISKLNSNLNKSGDLHESLRNMPFEMQYSAEFVLEVLARFPGDSTVPSAYQMALIYHCMAWIAWVNKSPGIHVLAEALVRCSQSWFSEWTSEIFESIVQTSIKTGEYGEDDRIILSTLQYFKLNKGLTSESSDLPLTVLHEIER